MGHYKGVKQDALDKQRRRRRKLKPTVSWADIEPSIIADFVVLLEKLDGAIRFGRSRDGAVYSIGFYVGEERWTEWIKADDDVATTLTNLFDEIVEDFSATTEDDG